MKENKNILVDIGHPAHVHLFRHFIREMQAKGHSVFVLTKNVASITQLLNFYGIPFTVTGKKPDSLLLKYFFQLAVILKTVLFVRKHKIKYGIGISMTLPIVARLTSLTVFGMDDDDTAVTPIFAKFINKSNCILTPDCLNEDRGGNHIKYPSFHELAYLHPQRFVPDPDVLQEAGIGKEEPFFILRFNAFKAHHDVDAKGLNQEQKLKLISRLKLYGRVFITTEKEMEPVFEPYRLPIPPQKIHSLLYYATLFAGDSQTMTTEAALLGTPAFKCNSFADKLSIPNEIEKKYQLCFSYLPEDFEFMLLNIQEHLEKKGLKKEFAERRLNMLHDKIDLTFLLIYLVHEFPKSVDEVRTKSIFNKMLINQPA
jgi:uncharacterized protein